MLRAAYLVFYTECLLGMRRSQEWLFPLCFFVIVVSLFPLAFSPDPDLLQKFFPGFIWIAALFASTLSSGSLFQTDLEEGYLEQMIFSDIPFAFLIFVKIFSFWVMTSLPLIFLTPILGMMFHVEWTTTLSLILGLLIGTPALTFINSFGTALTIGLKQQGVVLGLLVLPFTIPILIFGVTIVLQSQAHLDDRGGMAFLAILSLSAILFLPLAISFVLKAALDD
jgi:heme exporter protein B